MLPDVADHPYPVLRLDLVEESTHLLCAGKTRLAQHLEMAAGRIARRLVLSTSDEEALKGGRADPCLAELAGGPRRWGEPLDGVATLLGTFSNA